MWKPVQLGEIIAERRLVARVRHGRAQSLVVRFGRPVRSAVKDDPWWCPVEITGIGKPRFFAAAGEDSVQALVLALRAADVELATGFRNGQVEWLGDVERPIFFHTHVIDMYQGAIDNLLAAVRQAIKLVEDNPGAREWKKSITELRRIERQKGFSSGARRSNRK
jgi:hypothetical protein